jgi:ABC-2 type transport system ATP-binding protein
MVTTGHASGDAFVPSTIIDCNNLVVKFGKFTAVAGLNLQIFRGECFGLLGPNGAGKTTTVEVLEGFLVPTSGEVKVFDQKWRKGNDRAIRERLGVLLQETHLIEILTVIEILELFRSFYHQGHDPEAIITLVGLEDKRSQRVGKLSGGQRQRLALGCSLIGAPELLFLDEPTTGLDPQARLRVWEVVKDFIAGGGTVVVTTHYMEEAAHLCDRIAIIDHGKLLALDTPRNLIHSLGAQRVIEIEVEQQTALSVFEHLPSIKHIERRGRSLALLVEDITVALPELMTFTKQSNLAVKAISTHEATLEDVFIHLTGRGLRNG